MTKNSKTMQDQSLFNSSQPQSISEGLQNFIIHGEKLATLTGDWKRYLDGYAKGVYYIAIQGIHKQYKKKIIIN